MTNCAALWIDRTDINITRQVTTELPELIDGQVLVAIDKFGLTANNVSYAVTGDSIGYWQFYPAQLGHSAGLGLCHCNRVQLC